MVREFLFLLYFLILLMSNRTIWRCRFAHGSHYHFNYARQLTCEPSELANVNSGRVSVAASYALYQNPYCHERDAHLKHISD